MTTIAAGSSATITVASGGKVAVATNGGLWSSVETPTGGSARTVNHGPVAHTRVFGPYDSGASLTLNNISANQFLYVDYEVGTPTIVNVAPGASQTITLSDMGTAAVATSGGMWTSVTTPAIGNPSTRVHGPISVHFQFGPYPVGATVAITNQTATSLLAVVTAGSSGGGGNTIPAVANLVRQWSADAITPQTDNTSITTGWTDSVGGINLAQASGALQPKYRTNQLGGKPGILFSGTQFFSNTDAALKAIADTKTFTVYILADKITSNTNGTLFGNSSGGNSFMFQANGALIGRFNATTTELRGPYTDTVTPISLGYTSSATKVYSSQSGTGLERSYLNGMCVTSNTVAFPAINYAADGSFAIGSLSSVGTASFCAKATIYEVMVWNRVLTEVEMAQVEIWARTKYSLAMPYASLPRMFHFDGDSLTVGVGTPSVASSYPYQNAQSLGLTYGQWAMHAVGGVTTQDMSGLAASPAKLNDWIGLLALTGIPGRVMAWEWYNEKNTGRTAQAYTDMVTYCSTIRAAQVGLKLCLGSSTGYTGDAADPYAVVRGAYNALLDTNNATLANAYVAIHADANIGDGSSFATNSATYWIGDGVHLNAAGRAVLAGLMLPGATAINN